MFNSSQTTSSRARRLKESHQKSNVFWHKTKDSSSRPRITLTDVPAESNNLHGKKDGTKDEVENMLKQQRKNLKRKKDK